MITEGTGSLSEMNNTIYECKLKKTENNLCSPVQVEKPINHQQVQYIK